MKQRKLYNLVNRGMRELVEMGMPKDYAISVMKIRDFPEDRHNVEILINPFEKHFKNSYLAFAFDEPKRIIDNVRAGLRGSLAKNKDLAEASIYILGDIAKELDCEWMVTYNEQVAEYGPWIKYKNGHKINVDLFCGF